MRMAFRFHSIRKEEGTVGHLCRRSLFLRKTPLGTLRTSLSPSKPDGFKLTPAGGFGTMLPPENRQAVDCHEGCRCIMRFRAFLDATVDSGIRILRSSRCPRWSEAIFQQHGSFVSARV